MATASPSLGEAGAVWGSPAPAPEARAAPEIRCAGFKNQIQQVLGWKKGIKQLSATGESRREHGRSVHFDLSSPGLEQVSQFVPVRGGGSERSIQFALGKVMRSGRGQMVFVSTSEVEPRVKAVGLNLVSPSNRQQVLDSTAEKASSAHDLGKRLTQDSQSALGKCSVSDQATLSGMNEIAGLEQVVQTASGVGGSLKQIAQSALGMSVIQFTLNENGRLEQVIQTTVGENGSLEQGTQSTLPEIKNFDWIVHSALSKCCGSEQVTQCELDQRDDHGFQPVDGCRSESEEQTQFIVSNCKSEMDLHHAQGNSVVPEQPNLLTKAMNLAPDPRTGNVTGLKLESEEGVQGKEESFPLLQHNLSATRLKEWVKLAPFQDVRSGWDKKLEQCLQLPLVGSRTSSQQMLPLECQDVGSSDFTQDIGLEQQMYITLSQSLDPFSGLCVSVQLMEGLRYPPGPGKRDWGAWPKVRRREKSCPSSLTKRQGSIRSNSSSSNRVRFADSIGLELAEVRSFDSSEEPTIPAHVLASFSSNEPTEQVIWIQRFRMEFTNPRDDENFSERLNSQKVCLEAVSEVELVISGTILVINLAYHKEVTVRYTCNDWKFFSDVSTLFESNIEGKMDRFTFTLNPSIHLLQPGSSLQFAIKYKVEGLEFWDNNSGSNYKMTYQSFQVTVPNDNEDRTVDFN